MSKFSDAVSALRKADETKSINGLKIINVNVTAKDEYTLVALTLDSDIPAYTKDTTTDTFVLNNSNLLFTTLYSINAVLRNNDDSVGIVNYLQTHSTALASILIGSKIDIIQQHIDGQTTDEDGNVISSVYFDYWQNKKVERSDDYDTIFNHIVNIEFSEKALAKIEKIEDKLLFESDDHLIKEIK